MRSSYLVVSFFALATQGSAQINLNTLVSEVYSVYTEVTSIWASDASAASAAASSAATANDSSATSNSSTGSATSSSSTSASPTSAAQAKNSASQTASNAAASATSAASLGHGNNHRTLAIILGCVLGALALGLLILVLLLCCRRRRRRDSSTRNVHSPQDDEAESWRHGRRADTRRPGSSRGLLGQYNREAAGAGAVVAPSMAEHPAFRNPNHDNPFVPTPPVARRTMPNSRAGLTDSLRPGEEPFLTDPKTGKPINGKGELSGVHKDNHHKGEVLAAGLGGAGLAGAVVHHRHKKGEQKRASEHDYDRLHSDNSDNHRNIITPSTGPSILHSERAGEPGNPSNVLSSTHHHRGEEALGGAALAGAAMHHHNKTDRAFPNDHERGHDFGGSSNENRNSVNPPGYTDSVPEDNHHGGEALAAGGLGGAGLAGAAVHHHNKNNEASPYDNKHSHDLGGSSVHDSTTINASGTSGTWPGDYDHDNHHKGEALAAGLGGAGLAGAAMHHHHKKEKEKSARKYEADLLRNDGLRHNGSITRKPVASSNPISPVRPMEAHSRPFPTTTTNDDAYALNKVSSRRSGESARRQSPSRDRAGLVGTGVGNDGYSVPYESTQRNLRQPNTSAPLSSVNQSGDSPRKSMDGNSKSHGPLAAEAAGVGSCALAGAAVAHHHDRKSNKSRSRSRSQRRSFAGIGDKKPGSNSDYSTSTTNSGSYEDAVPVQTKTRPLSGTETRDMAAEVPEDVPPTPTMRSRRNSALGTGAPSAALGSYQNSPNPLGYAQTPFEDIPPVPAVLPNRASIGNTAHGWGNGYSHGQRVRRDQTPPSVPSRSPRRARFSDVPFDSAGEPVTSPSGGRAEGGIVGDNRYPHMGVPSRRNTDDFESVVPLRNEGPAPGLRPSMDADRDTSSEDSTWRLSSGMPGGWRKERTSSMGSESAKRASGGWFMRDSGVSGVGSSGSRSASMTSASGGGNGNGNGQGRRLRLADLRREEEMELRARGRKSMENEWSGNGGYDGYEYHDASVGQAL